MGEHESVFRKALAAAGGGSARGKGGAGAAKAGARRWCYVHEDQLHERLGPWGKMKAGEAGMVLVEHWFKAGLRPYHRQRLALVWANQRQFALEQAARGVAVRYVVSERPLREALAPVIKELGPLAGMTPAEREARADVAALVEAGGLTLAEHDGWLTSTADFRAAAPKPPYRMDAFYRHVRRRTGILMEADGRYVGGKLSFDAENRERWDGLPPAPEPPRFEADGVTREVAALVEDRFARHPGRLDAASLPATREDAAALWAWAREACLAEFGPFEDAMSVRSRGMFHTRISALMNLHRLLPREVVREAAGAEIPLASKEGFIRQILGWREFVRHVHEATDGFRELPGGPAPRLAAPGDGGYARWAGRAWETPKAGAADVGSAAPSFLGSDGALPPAFWGAASGLACVDEVVRGVWEEAWSHHITRLMVLGNVASLLDVSPRELTDWFWVAYADAWDWVVEPNVLGMAQFALGGLMTTKPYVAGSAYIARMSDYCGGCAFRPEKDCPIGPMYWAYLARHEEQLKGNPRLAMPMRSLAKRPAAAKARDAAVFAEVREVLVRGERVRPKR